MVIKGKILENKKKRRQRKLEFFLEEKNRKNWKYL
jgi:hypothetical protein